jgi:hypothetical protein
LEISVFKRLWTCRETYKYLKLKLIVCLSIQRTPLKPTEQVVGAEDPSLVELTSGMAKPKKEWAESCQAIDRKEKCE